MKKTRFVQRRWVVFPIVVGLSILSPIGLCEEERGKEFVEDLRSRKQYDTALEFLDESTLVCAAIV